MGPQLRQEGFLVVPVKYACAQWPRRDLDDIIARYKAIAPRLHEDLDCLGIETILASSLLLLIALRYRHQITVRVLITRVLSWSY